MLISIITPSLNRAEFIEEAIQSVLDQDYPHVEHLIMDGGSTDRTLEILAKYPHLRVISESDQGLYDAINKGIQQANGEIIGILNTDDLYEPNIFRSIVNYFMGDFSIDAISGTAILFEDDPIKGRKRLKKYPFITQDSLFFRATQGEININAWFFRKHVFQEVNYFNIIYSLSADRDFMIRFSQKNILFLGTGQTIYHYRRHAGSLTQSGIAKNHPKIFSDNRLVAEYYLNSKELSHKQRIILRNWHSQITSMQSLAALRNQSTRQAFFDACAGIKENLLWPFFFSFYTMLIIWTFIQRKYLSKNFIQRST